MEGLAFAASSIPLIDHAITEAGWAFNFFLFEALSADLNAALIIGFSTIQKWLNMRKTILSILVIAGLTSAAQAIMPKIENDAIERSRPRNVP